MATRPLFRYEHRSRALLPWPHFLRRLARHAGVSAMVLVASLGMGVLGYRTTEGLSWLDALLNASMILGGMGPVDTLHTTAGKLFASSYALYSGAIFLVAFGIVVAPIAHRILHRLHLEGVAGSSGPRAGD